MDIVHPRRNHNFEVGNLNRAAFQAFLEISKRWKLKQNQQRRLLGDIPKSTFHTWKNNIENSHNLKLSKDTIERISYLLGIYKNLNILLSTQEAADSWIHKPNMAFLFNGQTALDKMLAGNVIDLADVRRFLDEGLE